MRRRWAALSLAATALVPGGCGGDEAPRASGRVLTVYASMPLSGPSAPVGRDVLAGARLAHAEAERRDGDVRVRLRALDAADPARRGPTAARVAGNARRAAGDPSTIAYLGEADPGASAVSVVILNQDGIPAMSPADGFAGLTGPTAGFAEEPEKFYPSRRRTFARVVADDDAQAAALVGAARARGVKRLAVLEDDGVYGRALAAETARRAAAAGLEVPERVRVAPGRQPPRDLVVRVRALRPDGVLYAGELRPGLVALWRALHAALPRALLLAPGALAVPAFHAELGPAGGATVVTSPALPAEALGADASVFRRAFRRRFARAPGGWAPYGYEAMRAVLAAVRRAGPRRRDRRAVVRALFRTRAPRSVLGPYAIEPDGDTTRRTIGSFEVRRGRLVLVETRRYAG